MDAQPTRRMALAAVAALPLAALAAQPLAAAPAREVDVWERELRAFRVIEAAHDAYDRDFWTPAYEAELAQEAAAGNPHPKPEDDGTTWSRYHAKAREIGPLPSVLTDEVNAEMERHQEAYLNAMDHLIETVPAPHCGAVLLKLEWALRRSECFEGLFDDHREAILADLRRLADRGL